MKPKLGLASLWMQAPVTVQQITSLIPHALYRVLWCQGIFQTTQRRRQTVDFCHSVVTWLLKGEGKIAPLTTPYGKTPSLLQY